MSLISDIQEYIDQHKAEIPTGVVEKLLEKCQEAYESEPKLYKVTVTEINADVKVYRECSEGCCDPTTHKISMTHKKWELLLEKVNNEKIYDDGAPLTHFEMVKKGFMPDNWLNRRMPIIQWGLLGSRSDNMLIISSIVPYRKRPRDEEE